MADDDVELSIESRSSTASGIGVVWLVLAASNIFLHSAALPLPLIAIEVIAGLYWSAKAVRPPRVVVRSSAVLVRNRWRTRTLGWREITRTEVLAHTQMGILMLRLAEYESVEVTAARSSATHPGRAQEVAGVIDRHLAPQPSDALGANAPRLG